MTPATTKDDPLAGADEVGERLVAAAARVFSAKGYDGAGVQEIAREAGLTTGAIYSRYAGKAPLLRAAIEAEFSAELDLLFSYDAKHLSEVISELGAHVISSRSPGSNLLFEAFVASRRDAEVRSMLEDHMATRTERLSELIDGAKTDGLVDADLDTATIARFCQTVGLGALMCDAIGVAPPALEPWNALVSRLVSGILDSPS